jgi:uncharacterized protein YndB with AHSA1/START domain
MEITQTPIAKAEMLIRRPVAKVFESFIDPAITIQILVYQRQRAAK